MKLSGERSWWSLLWLVCFRHEELEIVSDRQKTDMSGNIQMLCLTVSVKTNSKQTVKYVSAFFLWRMVAQEINTAPVSGPPRTKKQSHNSSCPKHLLRQIQSAFESLLWSLIVFYSAYIKYLAYLPAIKLFTSHTRDWYPGGISVPEVSMTSRGLASIAMWCMNIDWFRYESI